MEGQVAVVAFWGLFILAVLYLFVAVLVFPLEARLDAYIKKLFLMTFMVGIKNFSWAVLY